MKPLSLKEVLAEKLSEEEMKYLTTSFDIIGDIAVIEIKDELKSRGKLIGETLLSMHKNISTVCKRAGAHDGVFRTQKLKVIAGKRKKETIHKESGTMLKLNVEKCYFSVRSGTERLRIAGLVRPQEDVLVMFSGIGPYVCVIGKNSRCKSITGIELNPLAHKYAEENARINKIKNATLIKGDVKKIIPKLAKNGARYDRIIMPLPRTGEEFLEYALLVAKKGSIVHLYSFLAEDEFESYKTKVDNICTSKGHKIKIEKLVKCGHFSPKIYRACIDFEVR